MSRWKEASEVAKGLQLLAYTPFHTRIRQIDQFWHLDAVRRDLAASGQAFGDAAGQLLKSANVGEALERASMVAVGLQQGGPMIAKRLAQDVMGACGCARGQKVFSGTTSEGAMEREIDIEHVGDGEYVGMQGCVDGQQLDPNLLDPTRNASYKQGHANFHTFGNIHPALRVGTGHSSKQLIVSSRVRSMATVSESDATQKPRAARPAKRRRAFEQKLSDNSQESRVPSSRIGRLVNYSALGVGLGVGTVSEMVRQTFGSHRPDPQKMTSTLMNTQSPFLTEANAERIVKTLCKVRGAALKLGQMLSIQDSTILHPQLQQIFERVRQSADFMPFSQVEEVLKRELGENWREKVGQIDEKPFAAASIGQVHRATLPTGEEVALKIQYPGVSTSIDSDISNLMTLLNFSSLLPKGLYAEEAVDTARIELADECNYVREAWAANRFRELIAHDPTFYVPTVFEDLTTKEILTSEIIFGRPVDSCLDLDQKSKDFLAQKMIELCLKEVFVFRFMQSDPNWSNFFWDAETQRIILLDFGATREYSKRFVDGYLRIIHAAATGDRAGILEYSKSIGFLTGYEDKVMQDAHCNAVQVLGTALSAEKPMNFGEQDITRRIENLAGIMLKHRLTPPPPETYSIHRKMAGTFLLCTKLNATVFCRPLFDQIYEEYVFDDK